jgi:hypothetical protein
MQAFAPAPMTDRWISSQRTTCATVDSSATLAGGGRERVDGFASLEDFGTVLDSPGNQVEDLRHHVVFLPR